MKTFKLINLVLLLVGAAIMALGLNIGLGGIQTLGWQLPRGFVTVSNPADFAIQDSHIRFIGGLWFGIGACFAAGSLAPARLSSVLIIFCGLIALAGLFRFSGLGPEALRHPDIAPSLALEILGFPTLAIWLFKSHQTQPA